MSAPYEIIAAPFTVWTAAVGTSFPAIDAAPGASWVKLGTSGDRNYGESGVKVTHEQTISLFRALGSTGPRKAFRTAEGLRIALELVDMTLEHYKQALNRNAVTDVAAGAGTAGYRRIDIYRGLAVAQMALLVRGASPYDDETWNLQFQVPVAIEMASPAPAFVKGTPAGLALEFAALEDPNAATAGERFGRIIAGDAAAL